MARVLDAMNEKERARAAYEKHLEINPLDGPSMGKLGQLLLDLGQFEKAAAQLEKAVAIVKDDAWLHACLGRSYAEMGKQEQARAATN